MSKDIHHIVELLVILVRASDYITGIMTVLTMAFLGIENRRDLPKVSYSTALDYFVGVCFAFVLSSILQFTGVHFFTKHGSGEVFIIPESSSSSSSDDDYAIEEEPPDAKVPNIT